MSEVDNAVEGAQAATLPDEKPVAQEAQAQEQVTQQEPASAETDAQKEERARDEKGRFQKRVNELTKKTWDARREADQYRQRLEAAEAELSRFRQPAAPDPNVNPEAYVQHLAREEARRLFESAQAERAQQQEQERIRDVAQRYGQREMEYAAQHEDYAEAADAFVSMAGQNLALAEVLMSSEHGPAVVHYLGRHLDEAAQIVTLPPHLAAAEIARIEARLSAPKPTATTRAPAPVPTLASSAVVQKDPSKMSYADYKAWRQSK